MYFSVTLQRLAILLVCLLSGLSTIGCTRLTDPDAIPTDAMQQNEVNTSPRAAGQGESIVGTVTASLPAPAAVQPVEVPITVEVTRVFTQSIVVAATPTPPQPCADADFRAEGTLTIGALLPLSGTGAFSAGFAMQTALNLAVETIRAQEGYAQFRVRLVTYDTAGDPDRAAEFANRLITLDCAAAIVGGFHGSVALATAAVTEQYQVPYLVLHAAADSLTGPENAAVFRLAPALGMYAQMPAALVDRLNTVRLDLDRLNSSTTATLINPLGTSSPIDDVLIIGDPAGLSPTLVHTIIDNLAQINVQAELLPVDLPSQDFSSTVARILSRPNLPQLIFILVHDEAALQLQSQLLHAGIGPEHDVQLVTGFSPTRAQEFWQTIPQGAGTLFSHFGPWPGESNPVRARFIAQYAPYAAPYTDGWPPAYVFAAHDAVWLIAHAALSAPTLTGPDLRVALGQIDLNLSAGHYVFQPSGNPGTLAALEQPWSWQGWSSQQWSAPPLYYLRATAPNQSLAEMEVVWDSTAAAENLLPTTEGTAP